MVQYAHVLSIPAIRDFKVALLKFHQEASAALEIVQTETQRANAWIEYDRPSYWKDQVRRGFDGVAAARSALATCEMRKVAGHRPSCIEEKQALARAKRRLQHCQDQVRRTQQWATKIHQECDDFRARMSGLRRLLDADIPRMLARLEKMLTALEDYAETAAPDDADQEDGGEPHED